MAITLASSSAFSSPSRSGRWRWKPMPPDSSPPITISRSSMRSTTYLKPMPCSISSRPCLAQIRSSILVVLKARVTAPSDPVKHLGGIEGARDGAGPAFAPQHPTEQDGIDLVRIDEVALIVGGADAVRVAVRAEPCVAAVGHHRLPQGANVGLDRFGVNAGKKRVGIATNLHVGHTDAGENV